MDGSEIIGFQTAELLDEVDASDLPEGAKITAAVVIVEIDDGDRSWIHFRYHASMAQTLGMLRRVEHRCQREADDAVDG